MDKKGKRFFGKLSDVTWSLCFTCIHRIKYNVCKAYPKGIPQKILDNEVDHQKPYKGDHGIQFELDPEMEEFTK